jgi:diguanylate cyclase
LADPIEIGARAYSVGVAIGIAMAPNDGSTSDDLLKSADLAMYEAKRSGVSNISFSGKMRLSAS